MAVLISKGILYSIQNIIFTLISAARARPKPWIVGAYLLISATSYGQATIKLIQIILIDFRFRGFIKILLYGI